jgi:hypothetical protein
MMSWEPGAAIVRRSVKDGVVRSGHAMRVVQDEPELIALYLCPGSVGMQRKGRRGGPGGRQMLPDGWTGEYEERTWHSAHLLILYRPGDAYSVSLFWREADGVLDYWYVNLEDPWRRTALGFDTWDHTLDIVVTADLSSWRWKDEDELAWAQENGLFTAEQAGAIRAEGARAARAIEARAWPYQEGWERWRPEPRWGPLALPPGWQSSPS